MFFRLNHENIDRQGIRELMGKNPLIKGLLEFHIV